MSAIVSNYQLLANAWLECRWAIQPDEIGREKPPAKERLDKAANAWDEYFVDFEKKKIFLSEETQKSVYEFSSYVTSEVGKNIISTYKYYVNLRSILPSSNDATQLSYVLSGFIYDMIEEHNLHYDYVAVNRNGNSILGYLISNFLSIPLLIVNYDSRWVLDGKRVKVDGIGKDVNPNEKKVFLVDDAVSDGTILKESCSVLGEYGFISTDVYVLFSRKEDDAIGEYNKIGLSLYSIFNLGDSEIKQILDTGKAELPILLEKAEFK